MDKGKGDTPLWKNRPRVRVAWAAVPPHSGLRMEHTPPLEFCACARFGAAAMYARTTTGICYPYPVHAWERRPLGMGAGILSG